MTAVEKLEALGYEDVICFSDYGEETLIGITEDNRAVYDFDKMVWWLMVHEDCTYDDAVEWIDYNTIRSLPYVGENAPIIMYPIDY